MDWNDPVARYELIEQVGPEEYNRQLDEHFVACTVMTVNGHDIRKVGSRFGVLFAVGQTRAAFEELDRAVEHAEKTQVAV